MLVNISAWVVRICGVLALILGILFWTSTAPDSLIPVHMLLGVLVTLALFALGYSIGTVRGGSWGLAAAAFVLGLIVIGFGFAQQGLVDSSFGVLVKIVHLLFGLAAIGLGEMISGRYKRLSRVAAQSTTPNSQLPLY